MRTSLTRRSAAVATLLVLALTGCGSGTPEADTSSVTGSATDAVSPEAEQILAERGLDGMDTVELIDHLDRLGGSERPQDLMASVRPDQLVLSTEGEEASLPVPEGRFYLSVAPYVEQTHECFNHSLTTCTGELASTDVEVTILDETNGEVLVDETVTTFENGFVGFWLPRDIEGTVQVTHDGRTGEVDIATGAEDPTCLTTLQLT